eukprot:ANDGO_01133.mRNA.1 putative feruloyl esterase A
MVPRPDALHVVLLLFLLQCVCGLSQSSSLYNTSLAEKAVILASTAYCDDVVIRDFTCALCSSPLVAEFSVVDVVANESLDISGYVGYYTPHDHRRWLPSLAASRGRGRGKGGEGGEGWEEPRYGVLEIVLSFRGTSSELDWLEDLHVYQVPFRPEELPNMWVHQGFYDAYLSVSNQVADLVQFAADKFPDNPVALTCTGHSLGAALALFACLDIMQKPEIKTRIVGLPVLYNFGQPRLGNSVFASYIETQFSQYFRLVHNRDLVPHVPVTFVGENGYLHGGIEVWYNEPSTSFVVCKPGDDPSCSDQQLDLSIHDHLFYLAINMAAGVCHS